MAAVVGTAMAPDRSEAREDRHNPLASIEVIPHEKQRYDTVGDWRLAGDGVAVTVSRMDDWRYELLVGVHELIEASLCKQRNITDAAVMAFDKAYEAKRPKGNTDEPGDDPTAPYHREHVFATEIEKRLAAELGVDWATYDAAINAL